MKTIVKCVALLFLVFHSQAEEDTKELPMEYHLDSICDNNQLESGKAKVIVRVRNPYFVEGEKILYGYDKTSFEAVLDATISFEFTLDSGPHFFQFFPPGKIGLAEITTRNFEIKEQTTSYFSIHFNREEIIRELEKPVIYLYPKRKTDVSVKVNTEAELYFTYPTYQDEWNVMAYPNGDILLNDETYNYLFWEANYTIDEKELNELDAIKVVKGDLVAFLETSLDEFGFTSQEKMDFISYWAPSMLMHEATEIRFMFNEQCSEFAELEINPTPENLLRLYMIWNPTSEDSIDATASLQIPRMERSGFTVVEWGGMKMTQHSELQDLVRVSEATK